MRLVVWDCRAGSVRLSLSDCPVRFGVVAPAPFASLFSRSASLVIHEGAGPVKYLESRSRPVDMPGSGLRADTRARGVGVQAGRRPPRRGLAWTPIPGARSWSAAGIRSDQGHLWGRSRTGTGSAWSRSPGLRIRLRSTDRARLGVSHPFAGTGMVCCDRDQTGSIKATITPLLPGSTGQGNQTRDDHVSGHDRAAHPACRPVVCRARMCPSRRP